jgi:hypothetical protein
LPRPLPTRLPQDNQTPGLTYPPASPLRYPPRVRSVRPEGQPLRSPELGWARTRWYRNINRLCIDYASRPRLSSRLTLGGLAFPRNPWAFGGGVSHPSLATHTRIRTRTRSTTVHTAASRLSSTLPYHSRPEFPMQPPEGGARGGTEIRSFGFWLEPRYIVRAGPLDQ